MSTIALLMMLALVAVVVTGIDALHGMAKQSERELEELKKRMTEERLRQYIDRWDQQP